MSRRDKAETTGTDEQPLSDKPPLIDVEKLAVPSNLKTQQKVLR